MRTSILIITFLGLLVQSFGQNYVDLVRLNYNTTPANQFKSTSGSTHVNEMGLDLTYPKVMSGGKFVFLTGFNFEKTIVRFWPIDPQSNSVSSWSVRVGANIRYSEKVSATYLLIPKLASDFKKSTSDNFQFGAVALFKFTKTDRFNYKAGLYYNAEFFGPLITPLFGFYKLSENKKFEANVVLPQQVDVNYLLKPKLAVGLNFTGQMKSFRITELPSINKPGYVAKTTNELCGYLRINLTRQLLLYGRAGFSVLRSYQVYDGDDKIDLAISLIKFNNNRTQLNPDFKNGMVGQLILLYRFYQD